MKTLKVWNGRWQDNSRGQLHFYVCAYSMKDAIDMMNEYKGYKYMTRYEANLYWSECWGDSMEGIKQEKGLWIQKDRFSKPERVK